jgi:phosphotriesterase-related protein
MDRFGIDVIAPFEQRVATVAEMARRGYVDSMVLSHDASCYFDWIDPALMALMPNWHYLHITNDVLPALLAAGVGQPQIETMLVDNPRRWLETAA